MADSSQQSFLNTLFQWTVKNTATETASAPPTTENVQPMTEDVSFIEILTTEIDSSIVGF